MFYNRYRLFYDYRLNKPNGNFELKITPEQLIYQHTDAIVKVFPIFNQLPHRFKINYCKRILKFLNQYHFISKDNALVNSAVKISIAASYIKLTLGYNQFLINAFDKIIIYPTAKYFHHLDETHTGHFNPKLKVIMFALDEFQHDISHNTDGKDIALHEFSHALCFEMLKSTATHPNATSFKKNFQLIKNWFNNSNNKTRLIQTNLIRSYAYTNLLELISVLIELFFEKEVEFKSLFPDLYQYVGKMIQHPKAKSI